jgi:hypothetical protein
MHTSLTTNEHLTHTFEYALFLALFLDLRSQLSWIKALILNNESCQTSFIYDFNHR